jgi:hypothetical protein
MRQEYWKYLEGIISFDTTDTNLERPQKQKKFWSYIKNMKKDNTFLIKKQQTLNQ